jgi:hypothetical protein
LEGEGGGEGSVATEGMAEEEVIRLYGIRRKEKTARGDGDEVVGLFKDGRPGLFSLCSTIADEETGNVALDEALVEGCKELAEVLVGEAAHLRDEVYEWVEDDETGVNAFDSLEEGEEILGERERTITSSVKLGGILLNEGEEFDTGKIGTKSSQELELSSGSIGMRRNDDNAAWNCWGTVWHLSATGDGCGNLESEEGFPATVVAVEKSDTRGGETFLPEPADGLGLGLGKIFLVDSEGKS